MSCNVGDRLTAVLNGAPADGGGYTYVWNWWDGTSSVTQVPTVEKVLNAGGTLVYSVIQCDSYGRNHTYNGTTVVNSSPVVIGSPSISDNDVAFPFYTTLAATAYDPEHPGGTELSFAWYIGSSLISAGTTSQPSAGTYKNQLGFTGTADTTLTQVITDTSNGVTRVNYFVRGYAPSDLQGSSSSISNSIISSANNLSQIIIGPGQEAIFTAYAQDTAPGQIQFVWSAGTLDGWVIPFSGTELPTPLSTGLYRSQITRDISEETPGVKTVNCIATNLVTEQSISFNSSVNLIAAQSPTINTLSTDAPIINGGYAVSQSGYVHFSAQASDPNNALLFYEWTFTQPSVSLFGKTVMLRPADYGVFDEAILTGNGTVPGVGTGPLPILGQVTVTDRYNKTSTVSLSDFITTLVWPYTQVSPQTSGTGSTTLQKRYWGLSTSETMTETELATFANDFASIRNQTHSFTPVNQYVYIIYPASMGQGLVTITTDAPIATEWVLSNVTLNSVTYNVYRSVITLSALIQVTVS